MDSRSYSQGVGWLTFSAVVLSLGGFFALIQGLVAIYRSRFFAENAVFVFSDLNTWGWIMVGLGVAGIVSGLAVFTGRSWARWLGIGVAAVSALGQLLFAQAYPLWSLMIMSIDFLVIYGLAVYGREAVDVASRYSEDTGYGEGTRSTGSRELDEVKDETRRAA